MPWAQPAPVWLSLQWTACVRAAPLAWTELGWGGWQAGHARPPATGKPDREVFCPDAGDISAHPALDDGGQNGDIGEPRQLIGFVDTRLAWSLGVEGGQDADALEEPPSERKVHAVGWCVDLQDLTPCTPAEPSGPDLRVVQRVLVMVDELVAPHSVWMDGLDVFEIHVLRQHCGDAVRELGGVGDAYQGCSCS